MEPSVERLRAIGRWMGVNHEAIHATHASRFKHLPWGRCTTKPIPGGQRLYLHVFDWPKDGQLVVPGLMDEATRATLLSDPKASPLAVARREDTLVVRVPIQAPDPMVSVVVLDVQGRSRGHPIMSETNVQKGLRTCVAGIVEAKLPPR